MYMRDKWKNIAKDWLDTIVALGGAVMSAIDFAFQLESFGAVQKDFILQAGLFIFLVFGSIAILRARIELNNYKRSMPLLDIAYPPEVIEQKIESLAYHPNIVVAKFSNMPIARTENSAAKIVHGWITYYDADMNKIFPEPILGQWNLDANWIMPDAVTQLNLHRQTIFTKQEKDRQGKSCVEISIQPNKEPQSLILAIKHTLHDNIFAVSDKSFEYVNLTHPQFVLKSKKIYIHVKVNAVNINNDIEKWFLLSDGTNLEIIEMSEKDIKSLLKK